MPSYSPTQMYPGTVPMAVPHKGSQYPSYYRSDSAYSVSPPEVDASVSSSSGGPPSYSTPGYSATASYAGSSLGDSESERSASGVDFNEYMHEHLANAFDPLGLDKAMATQAQT